MTYLTYRKYTRFAIVIFGLLLAIIGAAIVLIPITSIPNYQIVGGLVAIVGFIFIILGFAKPIKKRDSAKAPIKLDTDVPPPPPPMD